MKPLSETKHAAIEAAAKALYEQRRTEKKLAKAEAILRGEEKPSEEG